MKEDKTQNAREKCRRNVAQTNYSEKTDGEEVFATTKQECECEKRDNAVTQSDYGNNTQRNEVLR